MNKPFRTIPAWKTAPFIRLLLPFIVGIVLQWYLQFSMAHIGIAFLCFAVAYGAFFLLPLRLRFRWQWLSGSLLHLLLVAVAAFVACQKDIRHSDQWFGHSYHDSDYLMVRINEPLTEKPKSFKAEAVVECICRNDSTLAVTGKLLLYFSKNSSMPTLQYGDRVLLHKPLQRIKNMGNPGSFDYERYAAFQQLFHNAFLKTSDYVVLRDKAPNPFWQCKNISAAKMNWALPKHC
jgi:competence protein ComEC